MKQCLYCIRECNITGNSHLSYNSPINTPSNKNQASTKGIIAFINHYTSSAVGIQGVLLADDMPESSLIYVLKLGTRGVGLHG
jgi:hypothetical protein